jgi:predicted LPLAT superfamily acyltransferase
VLERLTPTHEPRPPQAGIRSRSLDRATDRPVAWRSRIAWLNDKSVSVEFFGASARFATGPFLLAAILKCPIYLVFGLYREPNRYELFCEPFSDRLVLPRGAREEVLGREVARYARRLEDYCRKAPDNWFNFFDFWEMDAS